MPPREDILRRMLVSKQFLASNTGQLTPNSDAVAVAKMILTAHDAAELAAAAVADHVGVDDLPARVYLMDYPSRIANKRPECGLFPGVDFLRQLNTARTAFKHQGVLPDSRSWFRVVERTWDWVNAWCATYLGTPLDQIDLEQLLEDDTVRGLYAEAKESYGQGHYKSALEGIALAFYFVLVAFPGITYAVVGTANTNDALMLAPYGIRPSDFLNLQRFLPRVSKEIKSSDLKIDWDTRETGNAANWTALNVRFRLDTFLDIALKIQHAPWAPQPYEYWMVFDDVITPKGETADVWVVEWKGEWPLAVPVGKRTLRRIARGEKLRCRLSASEDPTKQKVVSSGLAGLLEPKPTLETADVLTVMFGPDIATEFGYVNSADVEITSAPKESDWHRKLFPHLYPK